MMGLNSVLLFACVLSVNVLNAEEESPALEEESNFQPPGLAPGALSPGDIPPVERFYPGRRCAEEGSWCLFSSHCCSRRCGWDFHCKQRNWPVDICIPDYGRCIESQQCCSGQCFGGYVCVGSGQYPQISQISQMPQYPVVSPFGVGSRFPGTLFRGAGAQPGAGLAGPPPNFPGGYAEQPPRG